MKKSSLSFNRIIDISQPVSSRTACFPGDVPFSKQVTLSYQESGVINLTAFTMSPHVGSHADAPVHIKGDLSDQSLGAAAMQLSPFLGTVLVIDLTKRESSLEACEKPNQDWREEIGGDRIEEIKTRIEKLLKNNDLSGPERVLFKTLTKVAPEKFEDSYAYIGTETAKYLAQEKTKLVGLDTPSVDHINAKVLATHHILEQAGMVWLENLDLSQVDEGIYQLIALPLKMEELEASPLRAVLLA
ncbi:MAG: cyclase family protein [Candidatus Obscuribacterales bacterium]|nr:cyclase family protein [Candidatus Obscuribacterales bacterium]